MKEALLYSKSDDSKVVCALCSHRCVIKPGRKGLCGVRENRGGVLFSLVYRKLIAQHVDPIEKKPLFHVLPGTLSYSIATAGCNFRCVFCQNADISQMPQNMQLVRGYDAAPDDVVEDAVRQNCRSIAYTYTEPTIFFEYALDVAVPAAGRGLLNVFVTNGYMSPECLDTIGNYLHAANVDLKSFRDEFYKSRCGARLQPVLDSIRKMKEMDVWVEITTLLIPGENDSDEEIRDIARFLVEVGRETPWHISRFFPQYRFTEAPPTPPEDVRRAREIGLQEGLKYVYTGNLPGDEGESTFCPACGRVVIDRRRYGIHHARLTGSACSSCGEPIDGIFP